MLTRVEFDALLRDSHLNLVASADDAVDRVKFAITRDLKVGQESLELLGALDDVNLVVGSEEVSKLLVFPILAKGGVGFHLRIAVVRLVVVGDSLATTAVADESDHGVANACLKHAVFLVGKLGVDCDVRAESHGSDPNAVSLCLI